MPLYNNRGGSSMPQAAQSAMSSATNAMAHQQKQETRTTKQESNFWDDLYKGARAIGEVAGAANNIADATNDVWKMYDEYKVRDAYDEMSKVYAEGGMDALQNNPNFQDYHHAQALGRIMNDRAKSEKGQLEIRQNAMKMAEQNYLDTRAALLPGLEAFKSGDMNAFNNSMVNASKISNLPYMVEPQQDGTYKLLFRSSEEGKFVDTGRKLSAAEVNQIGQEYLRGEVNILRGAGMQLSPINERQMLYNARSYMASSDSNRQFRDIENHVPLYDANGRYVGNAIKQVNIRDGSMDTLYETYGTNGQPMGTFTGTDLAQKGYTTGKSAKAAAAAARASGGGRSGGGGGRGRGGSGGNSGSINGQPITPGNYGVSPDGAKAFMDVCTSVGEDGSKTINYRAVAALKSLRRMTGKDELEIAGAYQQAMAMGLSSDQAIREMQRQASDYIGGQSQGQTTQGQAQPQQQPSQTQTNPGSQRILDAANNETHQQQSSSEEMGPVNPATINLMYQNMPDGTRQAFMVTKQGAIPLSQEQEDEIIAAQGGESIFRGVSIKPDPIPARKNHVTYQDVASQLSDTEKAEWQRTGKLPSRYYQVR